MMNELSPKTIVKQLFDRLRKPFNLGMQEYLSALDAIEGNWGDWEEDLQKLKFTLLLLWCSSPSERDELELIWESFSSVLETKSQETVEQKDSQASFLQDRSPTPTPTDPVPEPRSPVEASLTPLPIKAPSYQFETEDYPDLQAYWPVTRRSMAYGWRYLRRPVAEGTPDVLDVEATVERASRQGFFLSPVYRRREVNLAHLLLFVDRDGSMVPLHRFTEDLVETARNDSDIQRVEAVYFHNVPSQYVYQDSHLTTPIPLDRVLATCDEDTTVLIVSDGGAARGYRAMERFRATTQFLVRLKRRTASICWLNPIPRDRWQNSSAEAISYLVPMQQMDEDGFSNAIDIVRGQPSGRG